MKTKITRLAHTPSSTTRRSKKKMNFRETPRRVCFRNEETANYTADQVRQFKETKPESVKVSLIEYIGAPAFCVEWIEMCYSDGL